jgi:hypothetical protein
MYCSTKFSLVSKTAVNSITEPIRKCEQYVWIMIQDFKFKFTLLILGARAGSSSTAAWRSRAWCRGNSLRLCWRSTSMNRPSCSRMSFWHRHKTFCGHALHLSSSLHSGLSVRRNSRHLLRAQNHTSFTTRRSWGNRDKNTDRGDKRPRQIRTNIALISPLS